MNQGQGQSQPGPQGPQQPQQPAQPPAQQPAGGGGGGDDGGSNKTLIFGIVGVAFVLFVAIPCCLCTGWFTLGGGLEMVADDFADEWEAEMDEELDFDDDDWDFEDDDWD